MSLSLERMLQKIKFLASLTPSLTARGEIILSPNDASSETPREEDFLLTMADVLIAQSRAKLVVLSCFIAGKERSKLRAW